MKEDADAAVESAQTAYDTAATDLTAAGKKKEDTQKAYEEASASYDPEALEKAVTDAEAKVSSCETALNNAKTTQSEAQEAYDNIGRAFINEKCGSSLSVESLTAVCSSDSSLNPYVENETYEKALASALTVDNLNKAADFITECNQLRAKHDLSALKVNYRLMCMSAVSVAISSQEYAHVLINQWYSALYSSMDGVLPRYPSENLSWGGGDPFEGWYTEEKAKYEEYVASGDYPGMEDMTAYQLQQNYYDVYHQVGHYLNIIDGDMTIAGFARTDTKWTDGQLFAYGNSYGESVTPAEFKAALQTYSSDAKADLDTANTNVTNAQSALRDAQADLTAAETAKTTAAETVGNARTAADNAASDYTDAVNAEAAAKTALDKAKTEQEKIAGIDADDPSTYADYPEVQTAVQKINDASEAHRIAEAWAETCGDECTAKKGDLDAAKTVYDDAVTALEEAEKKLEEQGTGNDPSGQGSDNGTADQKTDIKAAAVSGLSDMTYTGKNITPGVKVKVSGKQLGSGEYTVSYRNNKNVGTATVIITGTGEYKGSVTKTFRIIPKGTTLKKPAKKKKALKVKWKKQRVQTTGYQIQVSRNKKFKSAKTVTIKKNKITSKKIKKLKAKKKYYVRVRTYKVVKGQYYYSVWSKTKKAKTK